MTSSSALILMGACVTAFYCCCLTGAKVGAMQSPLNDRLVSFDEDFINSGVEKRQNLRNALVRFGRSTGMRNALIRFGKRSSSPYALSTDGAEGSKRNGAPQPFVRFGRSGQSSPPFNSQEQISLGELIASLQ